MASQPGITTSIDSAAVERALSEARFKRFRDYRGILFAAQASALLVFFPLKPLIEEDRLNAWVLALIVSLVPGVATSYQVFGVNRATSVHGIPVGVMPAMVLHYLVVGCLMLTDLGSASPRYSLAAHATILGSMGTMAVLFGAIVPLVRMSLIALAAPAIVAVLVAPGFESTVFGFAGFLALFGFYYPFTQNRALREVVELRLVAEAQAHAAAVHATVDSITGLRNRFGLLEELKLSGATVKSLWFVDLDHFKEANDRFGHALGDKLLSNVADRIVDVLPGSALVARFGGDEFVVAFTTAFNDVAVAYELIATLEEPFELEGSSVYISASTGVAFNDGAADLEELLRRADYALYHAKETGRGRAVMFDDELANTRRQEAELQENLRVAIREGQLEFWGQPIYNLAAETVAAVELLVRWEAPDGKYVDPSVFVPIAEQSGLIDNLTKSAIAVAASCLDRWADDPVLSGAAVTINVSPISFKRGVIVEELIRAAEEGRLDPRRVLLEITENVTFHSPDVRQELERLVGHGFVVALDDFGTGYSSVSQLVELPISHVKIDRSILARSSTSKAKTELLNAIVALVKLLDHKLVAEGVETETHLEMLRSADIELAQGFLLSKPMPLEDLPSRAAGYFGRSEHSRVAPTTRRTESSAVEVVGR